MIFHDSESLYETVLKAFKHSLSASESLKMNVLLSEPNNSRSALSTRIYIMRESQETERGM